MVDTNEEDVSIRDIKKMLRAAENRLRNLSPSEALRVVHEAVDSCENAPVPFERWVENTEVPSNIRAELRNVISTIHTLDTLNLGDRASKVQLSKSNELEGRETAIALLFDITEALKKPLIFEHGFLDKAFGIPVIHPHFDSKGSVDCSVTTLNFLSGIFFTMPEVISDIVTIHGILHHYLPGTEDMTLEHRLVRLGMHYGLFSSSRFVQEAAEEGFVALAETTLDKIDLSNNKLFKEMAAYIIKVAKDNVLFSSMTHRSFLERVEALVDELRGVRELRQQEAGITPINPSSEKEPSPDHRKIRLLVDKELPTGTRSAIEEGFRRSMEEVNKEKSADLLKLLREKGGLVIDAPAFSKRPVPKPEIPKRKTPKPIKR